MTKYHSAVLAEPTDNCTVYQWRSQGGQSWQLPPPQEDWTAKNIIVESVVHTAELDVLGTQKMQMYA